MSSRFSSRFCASPNFARTRWISQRRQPNTEISRRNDQPFQIAFREAAKLVYGADSPYARVPEYATVAAVTRDDLLSWHQTLRASQRHHPWRRGRFRFKRNGGQAARGFRILAEGSGCDETAIHISSTETRHLFRGQGQTSRPAPCKWSAWARLRNNPDYYAIEVFNQFFGGSFSSRLFSNIRSKKGLAYAVGGGIGTELRPPGRAAPVSGNQKQHHGRGHRRLQ